MTAPKLSRVVAQSLLVLGFLGTLGLFSYKTYASVVAKSDKMLPVFVPGQSARHLYHRIKDFPGEFEPFFTEGVGWKHLFVRRFARFKMDRLGVSPNPRVLFGDDGWMYYNHEADSTYYPATDPRLPRRLAEWERSLPEWRAWLAERGIRLVVVLAPDKQSVYPEHLPAIAIKSRPAETPLDKLLKTWRANDPQLELVDLRKPLLAAKTEHQLYYKTDTHWNLYGARLGYQETARRLSFTPLPDSAFRLDSRPGKLGDLGFGQLGYWPHGEEQFDDIQPTNATARELKLDEPTESESRLNYLKQREWVRDSSPPTKCLLFHDSFGDFYFAKLLAEHFGKLTAVPSNHLDPEIIVNEKPDVVVLEIVERLFQGIGSRRPSDPPRRSMVR